MIVPKQLSCCRQEAKPEHFGVANVIGAAISKVSGTWEQQVSDDEVPCEEAIEKAKAVDLAVTAGAVRDTVQYRYDNEPLAYYSKNKQAEDKGCWWFEKWIVKRAVTKK